MNASTFDTLATAGRLRDAGFGDMQTRTVLESMRDRIDTPAR